ncbi:MAG: methenyltetrahydrofolate cyclohydrolase [Burkholderiales bacterium]
MIKDMNVQTFLDQLASQASTPGGGSAAAIMGAMGAALVSMVCNLTIGKKNYAAVENDLKQVLQQSEDLRQRLTGMVADDIRVFNQVMGAYGLPKDSDEQKSARAKAIQDALKEATVVPLACAKACADVIELSRAAAEKGNLNVISDAGVAVMAAYGALKSAALNVYINVGNIKDQDFASAMKNELESVLARCEPEVQEIFALVKSKL